MSAEHFEILVEEPSMEAFLGEILPRMLSERATFAIHAYQGKTDLLRKLSGRLRGYSKWLPETMRIVVVVDRDDDNCDVLKSRLDAEGAAAGFLTRSASGGAQWRMLNRIAIEELEAWFFGEWTGVRKAYPKVRASISTHPSYREPDAIAGGTWEALERLLRNAGYFASGLRKVEAARAIGRHLDPAISNSPSFVAFRNAVMEAIE